MELNSVWWSFSTSHNKETEILSCCVCTVVFQKFKWNAELIKWKWQEKNYVCVVCTWIVHVVFEVLLLAVGIAAEGNVLH